jgi:hypothetical protein
LSCLLTLGLFFTPLIIQLHVQYQNLRVEKQAWQLLYEELQLITVAPLSAQNHTTIMDGIEYQITVQESIPGQKEVCVKVEETRFNSEQNICQRSE